MSRYADSETKRLHIIKERETHTVPTNTIRKTENPLSEVETRQTFEVLGQALRTGEPSGQAAHVFQTKMYSHCALSVAKTGAPCGGDNR